MIDQLEIIKRIEDATGYADYPIVGKIDLNKEDLIELLYNMPEFLDQYKGVGMCYAFNRAVEEGYTSELDPGEFINNAYSVFQNIGVYYQMAPDYIIDGEGAYWFEDENELEAYEGRLTTIAFMIAILESE